MIALISVATWQRYLLVLELIPLGVAIWSWRAGTDISATGITVRAALGRRKLPWSEITEIRATEPVQAVLASGAAVTLTAVPARDLPKLAAVASAAAASGPESRQSDDSEGASQGRQGPRSGPSAESDNTA